MFAVIDGVEMIETQQLGQQAGIDLVTLVALLHGRILPRIAHNQSGDVWLQQVVQSGAPGSFFKRDVQISAQPIDKLQNHAGFRLDDTFQDDLAGRICDRDGDAFPVDIHADILHVIHWGCSFR